MQRKKQFLLLLSLFFISSNSVYASCTQEEIDNFKKIEDQYKVTYEFDIESKTYTLTFKNPNPTKYGYALMTEQDVNYEKIDENIQKIKNIESGEYEILVYGTIENCMGEIKKINLKLPKYNKYYNDPMCKGIEEFVLCQPTYDKDIERDTFESRINTYKKSKETKEPTNKNDINEENKIIKYIEENILQISTIIIFIIMLTITLVTTVKSIRKSRRLE